MQLISLIIVKNAVLDPKHLDFVIQALNQQSDRRFNTFWIDQSLDPLPLRHQLQRAEFDYFILHSPGPLIANVLCWELIQPFDRVISHPQFCPFFTYLHMECIPEIDFIKVILETLPEVQAQLGPRFIAMLQQLYCPLQLSDLHPRHYFEQLRHSRLETWTPEFRTLYSDYRQYAFAWFEQRWHEDAFLMPSALARELHLFSLVQKPLFFQDIFDIFGPLSQRAYAQHIKWLRIPTAICYHLQHARPFGEFSRAFLNQVRQYPDLFGHFGLYDIALTELSYQETDEMRTKGIVSDEMHAFYKATRWGERGTVTLWLEALDQAHRREHHQSP